jgi:hypothetical protein
MWSIGILSGFALASLYLKARMQALLGNIVLFFAGFAVAILSGGLYLGKPDFFKLNGKIIKKFGHILVI